MQAGRLKGLFTAFSVKMRNFQRSTVTASGPTV